MNRGCPLAVNTKTGFQQTSHPLFCIYGQGTGFEKLTLKDLRKRGCCRIVLLQPLFVGFQFSCSPEMRLSDSSLCSLQAVVVFLTRQNRTDSSFLPERTPELSGRCCMHTESAGCTSVHRLLLPVLWSESGQTALLSFLCLLRFLSG